MNLYAYIRSIPDFPKKGITYRDITPLLLNPEAMTYCVSEFIKALPDTKIDKVVGIESRGFFFAGLLAERLGAGLVPVRKAGKLPYNTLSEEYDLEYGRDRLEVHKDAILPGENVLLHDDVLATGGTALAACKLIERLEGKVVQCSFLLELEDLKGREKLMGKDVKTLINF